MQTPVPLGGTEVRRLRLEALGLSPGLGHPGQARPALEVVRRLGALQAQDHASGAWSIGIRSGLTFAEVEQAVHERQIVRTWPMRGTIHWVPAADARWMCALTGLRQRTAVRARFAELAMTEAMLARAAEVFAEHLGVPRSRPEVFELLEQAGLDTGGQRGYHYVSHFCTTGLLCQGPLIGRQHSFVLLDAWVPQSRSLGEDEAADTIVERYVRSHGPVSEKDIAGWLGHTLGFVRAAVARLGERCVAVQVGGVPYLVHADALDACDTDALDAASPVTSAPSVLLLPQWDEFLLGYKDRSHVLPAEHVARVVPGRNMVFAPTLAIDGLVTGTWRRTVTTTSVDIAVSLFRRLTAREAEGVELAARRYGDFLGLSARLSVDRPGDTGRVPR